MEDSNLKEKFLSRNYEEKESATWMTFEKANFIKKNFDKSSFANIKKVENELELEIFLEILERAFYEDSRPEIQGKDYYYGYCKKAWHKFNNKKKDISKKDQIEKEKPAENGGEKVEFFLVYDSVKKPVAVANLIFFGGISYFLNVGVLPGRRGEGWGKLVTNFCLRRGFSWWNSEICFLQVKPDTRIEDFYVNLGFEKKARTIFWVKKGLELPRLNFPEARLFLRSPRASWFCE